MLFVCYFLCYLACSIELVVCFVKPSLYGLCYFKTDVFKSGMIFYVFIFTMALGLLFSYNLNWITMKFLILNFLLEYNYSKKYLTPTNTRFIISFFNFKITVASIFFL